jgi:hypothetical protein
MTSVSFSGPCRDEQGETVPLSLVGACLEAIAARNPDLERLCPDAVELAATSTAALRQALRGRAADLAGDRAPRYFHDQLRGERALTGEDISRLAIQAPADTVEWLTPVLKAVAHGAPHELAGALFDLVPVLEERLQKARETVADIEAAVAPRVAAWKGARRG